MKVHSFDPIAGPDARVLVLGTMPGVRSLQLGQYYGYPRNAFWPIMLELFAAGVLPDYEARVALLVRSRVAVWDVLASANRPGSLDSNIENESVVANDIPAFLAQHHDITSVFFNGAVAHNLFKRHIAPIHSFDSRLRLHRLPSTSPANATASFHAKRAAWQAVFDATVPI